MSMAVDLSTPLTPEERAYLHMRGRTGDIELADNLHGESDDPALSEGDGTGPRAWSLNTAEARKERRERLLEELRELEKADGGSDDDEDEELPPYEDWNSKDLNTELKNRGLSAAGTNEEKAQRLYQDDAERAAAEAERQQ